MPKLIHRWEKKSGNDFYYVEFPDHEDFVGFRSYNSKKLSLMSRETQEMRWVFTPQKRGGRFGRCYAINKDIFLEEEWSKGSVWYLIPMETGEAKAIEGLGEWTFLRFTLDGYGVFEVDNETVIIDPAEAKPIQSKGLPHEFSPGRYSDGRCAGYGKISESADQTSLFIDLKIENGVAYFADPIELPFDPGIVCYGELED